MVVCVQNHWQNTIKTYSGTNAEIERDIIMDYPHLISSYQDDAGDLMALLDDLESNQAFGVSIIDDDASLHKNEDIASIADSNVLRHMLGYDAMAYSALAAARFLSSGKEIPFDKFRQGLYQYDGEVEKAALFACGIEPTQEALAAMKAVLSIQDTAKSEDAPQSDAMEVVAPFESGAEVAESIRRAFRDQLVVHTKLAGKHGKGAMVARDEEKQVTFLLKPGSGKRSPAAGMKDAEQASPSQREAAFYHAALVMGLENYLSPTELVVLSGQRYAAIKLLPWSYVTVEHRRKVEADPNFVQRLFLPLLKDGILHRWAVMDYMLGNSDRHGQNVMVGPHNDVVLLDHGSAFAGKDFSPGLDKYTFTPFYLRAWSPANFNSLPNHEKSGSLPRLNEEMAKSLADWIHGLDESKLGAVMSEYGIDPKASLDRLSNLRQKMVEMPADLAVNEVWSGS